MALSETVSLVASSLKAVYYLVSVVRSFHPLLCRPKRIEVDALVERVFDGGTLNNDVYQLSGILTPYVHITKNIVWSPHVVGPSYEKLISRNRVPGTNLDQYEKEVGLGFVPLSAPVRTLPSISLSDGSMARIWWLFPRSMKSFLLPVQPKVAGDQQYFIDPLRTFLISDSVRPVPVLVDISANLSGLANNVCRVSGRLVTSETGIFQEWLRDFSGFESAYLSNCYRPFNGEPTMFAIDARAQSGRIARIEKTRSLKTIQTLQAAVVCEKLSSDELFRVCVDAIPERSQRGPLRAAGLAGADLQSILTASEIRWVVDSSHSVFGLFREVDVVNKRRSTEGNIKMAVHWHAWMKRLAAKDLAISVTPLICSSGGLEARVQPGGLTVQKEILDALYSADPALKERIDWLGLAAGRPTRI